MRSIIIAIATGVLAWHFRHPSIMESQHRGTLVLRAALMLVAWLLFYNAARYLGLAELTTLYFSAPIIVILLSILILKEKVGAGRWIACVGGFLGVPLPPTRRSPQTCFQLQCALWLASAGMEHGACSSG